MLKPKVKYPYSYGHIIDSVAICGGLSSSDLYNQTISDVLNLKVIKPHEPESVLLGSAILASAAALKLENNSGKDTMNKLNPYTPF